MMMRGLLVVLSVLACKGEPKRSFCEALCDWTVSCHAAEREIDSEAALEECLAATRASDPSCERAESGKIDPASVKVLEPCVKDIDDNAAAGECDAITGSVDQIKTGTVPASCAGQADDAVATFDAAKDSTIETGEELCHRFAETFCARAEECIIGDAGGEIPESAIDAVGGTPYEVCVERLRPVFTDKCITDDLYAAEDGMEELNIARQAARECMDDFTTLECDALFAGDVSPACAASVSDPNDLVAIGSALFDLAKEYEDAIP